MGQLFNRLRDFARSQMRSSDTELRWAERMIGYDDGELRRIIDELNQEHVNPPKPENQRATPALPKDVLQAHTLLNVPVGASTDDMKKAYRKAIAIWHPDRFASATASEQRNAHARAHEINSAYVKLRDHYDFR